MALHEPPRVAFGWALMLVAAGLGAPVAPSAADVPAAEDIVRRVVAAQAAAGVVSADAEFKLRVHKTATQPPDCVFTGVLRVEQGHQVLRIQERSAGWPAPRAEWGPRA